MNNNINNEPQTDFPNVPTGDDVYISLPSPRYPPPMPFRQSIDNDMIATELAAYKAKVQEFKAFLNQKIKALEDTNYSNSDNYYLGKFRSSIETHKIVLAMFNSIFKDV